MLKYRVDNLNAKTPLPAQTKLIHALEGVPGVKHAILRVNSQEFVVETRDNHEIKREDIAAAASSAGFALNNDEYSRR